MGARAWWRRMLDRGVLTYNISLGRSPQLLGRASKKKKNIQGKIKTCARPFSDRLTPKRGRTTTKLFHPARGRPLETKISNSARSDPSEPCPRSYYGKPIQIGCKWDFSRRVPGVPNCTQGSVRGL